MRTGTLFATALLTALLTATASRAEETALTLSPVAGLRAGKVPDGTLLIKGRLHNTQPHSGFVLRCISGGRAEGNTCELRGSRNPDHRLKVSVMAESLSTLSDGNILIPATADDASFLVSVSGDQEVIPDTWRFVLGAGIQ